MDINHQGVVSIANQDADVVGEVDTVSLDKE